MLTFHTQHELTGNFPGRVIVSQIDWDNQTTPSRDGIDFLFKFVHSSTGNVYTIKVPQSIISDRCSSKNRTDFAKLFDHPAVDTLSQEIVTIAFDSGESKNQPFYVNMRRVYGLTEIVGE